MVNIELSLMNTDVFIVKCLGFKGHAWHSRMMMISFFDNSVWNFSMTCCLDPVVSGQVHKQGILRYCLKIQRRLVYNSFFLASSLRISAFTDW